MTKIKTPEQLEEHKILEHLNRYDFAQVYSDYVNEWTTALLRASMKEADMFADQCEEFKTQNKALRKFVLSIHEDLSHDKMVEIEPLLQTGLVKGVKNE